MATTLLPTDWEPVPKATAPRAPAVPLADDWEPTGNSIQSDEWEPTGRVMQDPTASQDVLTRNVTNPFMRGAINAGAALDAVQARFGLITPREQATRLVNTQQDMQQFPQDPYDVKREAAFKTMPWQDQVAGTVFSPELGGDIVRWISGSIPATAATVGGGVVGALGGPLGSASGAGLASFYQEYGSSINDLLGQMDMEPTVENVQLILQNPEAMAKLHEFAAKRGAVVGTLDAVSQGVAGKILPVVENAVVGRTGKELLGKVFGETTELTTQGALGATGEAGAQVATTGEVGDVRSVIGEFGGEFGTGIAEQGVNLLHGKPGVDTTSPAAKLPIAPAPVPTAPVAPASTSILPTAPVAPPLPGGAAVVPPGAPAAAPTDWEPTGKIAVPASAPAPVSVTPTFAPTGAPQPGATEPVPAVSPEAPVPPEVQPSIPVTPAPAAAGPDLAPSAPVTPTIPATTPETTPVQPIEPAATTPATEPAPAPPQQTPAPVAPAPTPAEPAVQPTAGPEPVQPVAPTAAPTAAPAPAPSTPAPFQPPAPPAEGTARPVATERGKNMRMGHVLRNVENGLDKAGGTLKGKRSAKEAIARLRNDPRGAREDANPEDFRIGDEVISKGNYGRSVVIGVAHKNGVTTLTTINDQGAVQNQTSDRIGSHQRSSLTEDPGPPLKPTWYGQTEKNPDGHKAGDTVVMPGGKRGKIVGMWKSKTAGVTNGGRKPINVAVEPEGGLPGDYKMFSSERLKPDYRNPAPAPAPTQAAPAPAPAPMPPAPPPAPPVQPEPAPVQAEPTAKPTAKPTKAPAKKRSSNGRDQSSHRRLPAPDLPANEEARIARETVVEDGKNTGWEHAIVLDENGDAVSYGTEKSPDACGFSVLSTDAFGTHGEKLVIHHNHPGPPGEENLPLAPSPADVSLLTAPGIEVVWAHTHGGNSFRIALTPAGKAAFKTKRGENRINRMLTLREEVTNLLKKEISDFIDSVVTNEIAFFPVSGTKEAKRALKRKLQNDAHTFWAHAAIEIYARAGLVDYRGDLDLSKDTYATNSKWAELRDALVQKIKAKHNGGPDAYFVTADGTNASAEPLSLAGDVGAVSWASGTIVRPAGTGGSFADLQDSDGTSRPAGVDGPRVAPEAYLIDDSEGHAPDLFGDDSADAMSDMEDSEDATPTAPRGGKLAGVAALKIGGEIFKDTTHARALEKAIERFGADSPEIAAFEDDPDSAIGEWNDNPGKKPWGEKYPAGFRQTGVSGDKGASVKRTLAAARDDRRGKGTLAPQTEDVARNKGPSKFRGAWRMAGLDPDEGNLKSPEEKVAILRKVMTDFFGFRTVVRAGGAVQDAVSQMLNMFHNVHFMMHALGLPIRAVSLDGTLSIKLENKKQRYFGVYRPGDRSIGMPGTSNSFAHEWMHALDHFMSDKLKGKTDELLSRVTRKDGLDPTVSIEAAFINLIHTMFFDEAALALKVLDLERDAAEVITQVGNPKLGQPTVAALAAQKTLDKLKSGSTRLKIDKTDYKMQSEAYDPGSDYWASVHEMLARAFEAYVASKVEALGGSNEFITKGEEAYLSDADRRLAMTFPKLDDRMRINAAFDAVIGHLQSASFFGIDAPASMPVDNDIQDDNHYIKAVAKTKDPSIGQAMADDMIRLRNTFKTAASKGAKASMKDTVSYLALNMGINIAVGVATGAKILADVGRFLVFSNRAVVNPIIKRNMKKEGVGLLRDAVRGFINNPGDGQYQEQIFENAGHQQSAKDAARLTAAFKANGFLRLNFTPEQNEQALQLLYGKNVPGADPRVRAVASVIRTMFDQAHGRATDAGRDIGYVVTKGYVPRIVNRVAVADDREGFLRAAEKLYRHEFGLLLPNLDNKELAKLAAEVDALLGNTGFVSRFEQEVADLKSAMRAEERAQDKLDALKNTPTSTPAQIAAAKAEVDKLGKEVLVARDALAGALRDPFAELHARDWHTRISAGDSMAFDSHGPAQTYSQKRTLSNEADDIMHDFYDTNVLNLTMGYLGNMNSRTAYHERAGKSGGNDSIQAVVARKDVKNRIAMNPSKYNLDTGAGRQAIINDLANKNVDNVLEMRLRSASELGVDGWDVKQVRRSVESVAGKGDKGLYTDMLGRLTGVIHSYTYVSLLGRMVWTAAFEPISIYLRTGSPKAMGDTFWNYFAQINYNAQSVRDRKALADAIGIITSPLYDMVLISTLGQGVGQMMNGNIMLSQFFSANGAAAITNAQNRAVMSGGFVWMRDMAQRYQHANTKPFWKKSIESEFKELGVRPEDLGDFIDWLARMKTLPTLDELNSKAGRIFSQTVFNFVGQVIQRPTRADKPMLANTPVGRLAFALTSYLYSFFSNVHLATYTRAKRNFKLSREVGSSVPKALLDAGVPAANTFVGGFAMLYVAQFVTAGVRDALFNGEQWEKHRKAGDLLDWLHRLALSRTGLYGPFDVIGNSLTGLKYERDLANITNGPGLQNIFNNIGQIAQLIPGVGRNSPGTNTTERNAAKAFYRLIIAPLSTAVVSALPDSPFLTVPKWSAINYLPSNAAANGFADALAGEAEEK